MEWNVVITVSCHRRIVNLRLILLVIVPVMWLGVFSDEMCTKVVPVQKEATRKVHVLRRVPAACSNWDKAWSWISHKNCGTKYRLDVVDVPTGEMVTYREIQVCCEDDIKCKETKANGLKAPSDIAASGDKFQGIILGSVAAGLIVLCLIVVIGICRRKQKCATLRSDGLQDMGDSVSDDDKESLELHREGDRCGGDDTNQCESEYAEINDYVTLPKYNDIFKVSGGGSRKDSSENPFSRASAPPITDIHEPLLTGRHGTGTNAASCCCRDETTTNLTKDMHDYLVIDNRETVRLTKLTSQAEKAQYCNVEDNQILHDNIPASCGSVSKTNDVLIFRQSDLDSFVLTSNAGDHGEDDSSLPLPERSVQSSGSDSLLLSASFRSKNGRITPDSDLPKSRVPDFHGLSMESFSSTRHQIDMASTTDPTYYNV